ncbi:hypothetical protein Ancab_025953 [Ancistrocladus abbreviatus]
MACTSASMAAAKGGSIVSLWSSIRSENLSKKYYWDTTNPGSSNGVKKGIQAVGSGGPKYKGTQKREMHLNEMIEKSIKEAEETCQGDEISDECKVAWDQVEEVSQAKADLRLKLLNSQDPLESFCQENPETDECRIYED